MLFLVRNDLLVQDRERTYLTAAADSGDTDLTVRAIDTNAWADDDWVIVGEIGSSNAEILQVNDASLTDGTTLTIDNAGSGGCRFDHAVGEPVYRIDYNQIKFYRATTESGSKTLLATKEIQPDDLETRYDDTSNTTGFGFVRFYNSTTAIYSPYSDAIPYTGRAHNTLAGMITRIRKNLLESEIDNYVEDTEIADTINEIQRDIINEWLWSFNQVTRSQSRVADQFAYDVDSDIKTVHSVRVDTQPIRMMSQTQWERFHWDTDTSSDTQSHATVWNNELHLYPRPASAAASTTLDGNISAAATTITVDSTTSFERGDYFRFQINDEVIYATGSTATTFTGCLRGQEGTTATTHTDGDTVTELDIVVTGQKVASNLENQNDTTVVPEPKVIIDGATAHLAHTKLRDSALGDRYDLKYQAGFKNLKDRYGMTYTGQFGRVKDKREVPRIGVFRNPNEVPENVQDV